MMIKTKRRSLREWLIHKLGGYVLNPYDDKDYWDHIFIEDSIYISKEHCKSENIENIENELALRLSHRLIKEGLARFRGYDFVDKYGDVRISGGVNLLKLKEIKEYNYKYGITFDKFMQEVEKDDKN